MPDATGGSTTLLAVASRRAQRARRGVGSGLAVFLGAALAFGSGALTSFAEEQKMPASCGLEFVSVVENWSASPPADPSTRRAMAVEIATWQGQPILYLNTGNGLRLYSLEQPLAPTYLDEKPFVCPIGCIAQSPGDYDWVQYNFSVCDECKYGLSHLWQAGMVLFDLGTASTPVISNVIHYTASAGAIGGFTFSHGSQQYLVVNYLDSKNPDKFPNPSLTCGSTHWAKLYLFNGTDGDDDLEDIQCVETAPGQSLNVVNGRHLVSDSQEYVYLIDYSSSFVHIFEVTGSGSDLRLQWQGAPLQSYSKFGSGLRADLTSGLLVTGLNASPSAKLWDISDLSQPTYLYTFDQHFGVDHRGLPIRTARAAIKHPIAWFGSYPAQPTYTFDVCNPNAPLPLQPSFWDVTENWNSTEAYPYLANCDAEFSPDGQALYLARYSVFEVVDVSSCTFQIFSDGFETGATTRWSATVWP